MKTNKLIVISFFALMISLNATEKIEYKIDKQKDFDFKVKKGESFFICLEQKELMYYLEEKTGGYNPLFSISKVPENYPLEEVRINLSVMHQKLSDKTLKRGGQFATCKFYGFSLKVNSKSEKYDLNRGSASIGTNIDKEVILKPYLFMNENSSFSEWKEVKGVKGLFFIELDFAQLIYRTTKVIVFKANDWELIKNNVVISRLFPLFKLEKPSTLKFIENFKDIDKSN